jgi:NitT/TauT family transport system substrate-binding protein
LHLVQSSRWTQKSLCGLFLILLLAAGTAGCTGGPKEGVLRLGYFPNLTHAQPLYGVTSGLYQEKLGATALQTQTFNAGPAAIEALLSRQVDVIYVGPSPTINAIEKTGLDVVVIVAGSASGGASFIGRSDVELGSNESYTGKKFASPQLGNTQDVALKHYLLGKGHRTRDKGGDVEVINAQNADILTLFHQRQIDGAWLPEPWATRLVKEVGGRVLVNESSLWPGGKFVTTQVVTTRDFLNFRRSDIELLLAAHVEATKRIQGGGKDVLDKINDGVEKATGKRLADDTLAAAFANIEFTQDPLRESFKRQYGMAHDLGFTKSAPPKELERVYDLGALSKVAPTSGALTSHATR